MASHDLSFFVRQLDEAYTDLMVSNIKISNVSWAGLDICTPGQYAMDLAVDILAFLDDQPGVHVKNTGWQNGFGLDIAVWLPIIKTQNLTFEVLTDGMEVLFQRASGPRDESAKLVDVILEFLHGYAA